jgi:hypothetical protein
MHPQDQLLSLYGLSPEIGLYKLTQIANRRKKDLKDYLVDLGSYVRHFAAMFLRTSTRSISRIGILIRSQP